MATFKRIAVGLLVVGPLLGLLGWSLYQLNAVRRFFVAELAPAYVAPAVASADATVFDGTDVARKHIATRLIKVAGGFAEITDVQFVPGRDDVIVVTQKSGRCDWMKLGTSRRGRLFEVSVVTQSELGLLGLAFHPRFVDNGKLYVNYNVEERGKLQTRISEWQAVSNDAGDLTSATELRVLLNVEQPYQNHNGGQLAFGPDGFLYIGLGDGGFRDDPHGNGQDRRSLLGKMLRIDVDSTSEGRPYAVPRDNPFVDDHELAPEVWAYGLRNPWRYSFDPRGRLIVADVGQDKWEEVSIAERGDNLGWNVREGRACFVDPHCKHAGMKDPIYVYGRDDGQSITGGIVYTGTEIAALSGKYVFADFVSGRLWALTLPDDPRRSMSSADVFALGRFPILPSAFARDSAGRLYVADFARGEIHRLAGATSGAAATGAARP